MKRMFSLIASIILLTVTAFAMPPQPIANFQRADFNLVDDGNMGGLAQNIFLCRASAISAITYPVAPSTELGVTPFAFVDNTAEVFAQIYHTRDTGEFRFETQGNPDGKSFKTMIEFAVPSLHKKVIDLCNSLLNEHVIAVGKDRVGKWQLMGSLDRPAEIQAINGGTGKAGADPRNAIFILEWDTTKLFQLSEAPQSVVTV